MPAILTGISVLVGLLFLGFGANAMVNHAPALEFFAVPAPITEEAKLILAVLSPVYGIRDIFMGVAIIATAACGNAKCLGLITAAGGIVAGVDGAVCHYVVYEGAMQHWGYAPVLVIVGVALLVLGDGDDSKKDKTT